MQCANSSEYTLTPASYVNVAYGA